LAAALRAARDYLIRLHPVEGQSRDTEPYPLIIVRPSGAAMYGIAQRAMQSSDFQFGYELVEEDWDLKYPSADPQLAIVEQRAIDQARIRQEALAAAAPRAYRHPALAAAGRFEFGDGDGEGGYGSWGDDSDGANGGGLPGMGGASEESAEPNSDGTTGDGDGDGTSGGDSIGPFSADADGAGTSSSGTSNTRGDADAPQSGRGSAGSTGEPNGSTAAAVGTQQSMPGAPSEDSSMSVSAGGQAAGTPSVVQMHSGERPREMDLAATRGEDWALNLAILSDDAQSNATKPFGKTIPLKPDTVESIDEFVAAVQSQIESWGMAGDGLYWRPVLQLHVAPDGARRAQDLARLLKNSGLEIPPPATANPNSRGYGHATR
jgi:hypothetical protein